MSDRLRGRDRAPSSYVLLRTQASRRPDAPAISAERALTWAALFHEVEELAAGLLSSGVRADHVALLAVRPGAASVVVELALRAIGAVPVRIGPGAGAAETGQAFTVAPVSLVVVDHPERVDALAGLPLGRAKLLDLTDTANLAGLVEVGRARLRQEPDAIAHADRMVAAHATLPRVVGSGGEALAPTESRQSMLLTAHDRVLLVGEPTDAFTWQVRSACLATGAALGWVGGLEELADAIGVVQPTVLALAEGAATGLEPMLLDATVGGRRWHSAPGSVLDAVAAVAEGAVVGGPRVPRGSRRRATAIAALRPWFGADLTQVLVAVDTSRRLRSALDALDIDVDVEPAAELERADLPRPAARRARPRPPLPQRQPSPVDRHFAALTRPEPVVEEEDEAIPASPHLRPLLTGESFLDRVLAEQAAARTAVPATST
ncbi:AMP-binding protein [Nocardioides currus]|uniref:AMP-dependent synthetase/ligase domain-containing protein n=1 Tax=Nocardioides currus TaxID=2133958 RepID=A0A2R7YUN3_9ACTN|nr:AMP-binding protein [Nocardioides currus]PUA79599.1 hypothetical protein C7S10_17905 [Nocardioides currus]